MSDVEVDFNIQTPLVSIEPVEGSTTTDANGAWSLALQQGLSGVFTISSRVSSLSRTTPYKFNVNIPATTSASFSSIIVD